MLRYTYDHVRALREPPYVRRNEIHRALDQSLRAPRVGLFLAEDDRYGVTCTLTNFHSEVSQIEIDEHCILVAVLDLTIFHSHDLADILLLLRNAIVAAADADHVGGQLSPALGRFDSCWEIYKRATAGHGVHLLKPLRTARCRNLLLGLKLAELGAIAVLPHQVGELAATAGLTPGEVLAAVVGVHLATSPAEHLVDHLVSFYHRSILPRLSRRLRYAVNLKAPEKHDLEIVMASLLLDLVEATIKPGSRRRLLISIDSADTLAGHSPDETYRRNQLARIVGAADALGFNAVLAGRRLMEASWQQELSLTDTRAIELPLIARSEVEHAWRHNTPSGAVDAVCGLAFADATLVPAGTLEDAWHAAEDAWHAAQIEPGP